MKYSLCSSLVCLCGNLIQLKEKASQGGCREVEGKGRMKREGNFSQKFVLLLRVITPSDGSYNLMKLSVTCTSSCYLIRKTNLEKSYRKDTSAFAWEKSHLYLHVWIWDIQTLFTFTYMNTLSENLVSCLQITKVPVQACHQKTDCQSCVSMKDPYCGWCVLEGKWVTNFSVFTQKMEQIHFLFLGAINNWYRICSKSFSFTLPVVWVHVQPRAFL